MVTNRTAAILAAIALTSCAQNPDLTTAAVNIAMAAASAKYCPKTVPVATRAVALTAPSKRIGAVYTQTSVPVATQLAKPISATVSTSTIKPVIAIAVTKPALTYTVNKPIMTTTNPGSNLGWVQKPILGRDQVITGPIYVPLPHIPPPGPPPSGPPPSAPPSSPPSSPPPSAPPSSPPPSAPPTGSAEPDEVPWYCSVLSRSQPRCDTITDEYDELMIGDVLVRPDQYAEIVSIEMSRADFETRQRGIFHVVPERSELGVAFVRTNANALAKLLYRFTDDGGQPSVEIVDLVVYPHGAADTPTGPITFALDVGTAIDLDPPGRDTHVPDVWVRVDGKGEPYLAGTNGAAVAFPLQSLCQS